MTVDLSKVIYSSTANSFKNTGVYSTSITMSGSLSAFQERQFTTDIIVPDGQDFVSATAKYAEFYKAEFGGDTTKYWQPIPTFDMDVPTTPSGTGINYGYLLAVVNGQAVSFIAGVKNGLGSGETIVSQTIDIRYVTYTLTR